MSITIIQSFRDFLLQIFDIVGEINQKYATPRIQMTPLVRRALLALRLYLLALVGILVYKFTTLVH